ncbi:hypothetical protein LZ30DRAFT_695146 [Colletotrichum cereale]|nr:hypothetical protein LZ30DRAFT_695146 [Colletotrichum cereale]
MPTLNVLCLATYVAAKAFRLSDCSMVCRGLQANLLLVASNPQEDISVVVKASWASAMDMKRSSVMAGWETRLEDFDTVTDTGAGDVKHEEAGLSHTRWQLIPPDGLLKVCRSVPRRDCWAAEPWVMTRKGPPFTNLEMNSKEPTNDRKETKPHNE